MITREQVADLQPGDIVEMRWASHDDVVIRGPLHASPHGELMLGWLWVRNPDGTPAYGDADLTIVSRAPRPLYVNHPRTEPVPGDVVRDADGPLATDNRVWLCDPAGDWWTAHGDTVRMAGSPTFDIDFPKRLWLLVDGEAGQVVP